MRLTPQQIQIIFKHLPNTKIFVFGSRLDDSAKGGDVDLLVETQEKIDSFAQARIKEKLEQELYLPFDILFVVEGEELKTFEKLVKIDAIELNMEENKVDIQKHKLKELIIGIQRCIYFVKGSRDKINFPIDYDFLKQNKDDINLFETLSAINERFSKLQDLLAQGLRHASILLGKDNINFLKVLAFYEKVGVIQSVETWQEYRITRNEAAHDYGINYIEIATHFNKLEKLIDPLSSDGEKFITFCQKELNI